MSPLTRFEKFAREFIEGSVDRLLGEHSLLLRTAGELAAAVEGSRQNGVVAGQYTITLHPTTLSELLLQEPQAAVTLEDLLTRMAAEGQWVFASEVHVDFISDATVAKGNAEIWSSPTAYEDEPTAVLKRKKAPTAPLELLDAYLIVNGRRHVTLAQPVTTIGRSLENNLVLEDPGVSRKHAQIRWRAGSFVLFDLGSRAGTFVNDHPVQEQELISGDVIMLGAAAMIYGQEATPAKQDDPESASGDGVTQELRRDAST